MPERLHVEEVAIPPDDIAAALSVPPRPRGLIAFAHGSGSSRFSPRNVEVARALNAAGFATLLLDLLTPAEAGARANVFDFDLLARRVAQAIDWAQAQPALADLPIGLFGASTGAAAALQAAAARPERVCAVVSRGGRPDLAGDALPQVRAPTLLIVGGADEPVLTWNRQCLQRIGALARVEVVPGAGHLFEEPGAMAQVVRLAREWFLTHLAAASTEA
jgi:pimeloyl-ACP methyl ester carboxylesterase